MILHAIPMTKAEDMAFGWRNKGRKVRIRLIVYD